MSPAPCRAGLVPSVGWRKTLSLLCEDALGGIAPGDAAHRAATLGRRAAAVDARVGGLHAPGVALIVIVGEEPGECLVKDIALVKGKLLLKVLRGLDLDAGIAVSVHGQAVLDGLGQD